jgi:hypothetical protein
MTVDVRNEPLLHVEMNSCRSVAVSVEPAVVDTCLVRASKNLKKTAL